MGGGGGGIEGQRGGRKREQGSGVDRVFLHPALARDRDRGEEIKPSVSCSSISHPNCLSYFLKERGGRGGGGQRGGRERGGRGRRESEGGERERKLETETERGGGVERQTDTEADRRTDRERQTDRQTDRLTCSTGIGGGVFSVCQTGPADVQRLGVGATLDQRWQISDTGSDKVSLGCLL